MGEEEGERGPERGKSVWRGLPCSVRVEGEGSLVDLRVCGKERGKRGERNSVPAENLRNSGVRTAATIMGDEVTRSRREPEESSAEPAARSSSRFCSHLPSLARLTRMTSRIQRRTITKVVPKEPRRRS